MKQFVFLISIMAVATRWTFAQDCQSFPDSIYYEFIPEYQMKYGGIYNADTFPASIWYGSKVAIIVIDEFNPEERDISVMSKFVRGIEGIFDAYSEITGRTPPINSPLNGRIRVEFDKDRPGYGGGGAIHEVLGMFALKSYFEEVYQNLSEGNHTFDHVFFYEIHRNYWTSDLDRSIIYYPKPPHHQVIIPYNSNMTAAVNNTMAYVAPSIIPEIDDWVTGLMHRDDFGENLEQFYFTYVNDTNYTWENTWLSEFIPWSNGQYSLDNLQAGLLIHLYKKFGLEFYKRFYQELRIRMKVRNLENDYERVRDNLYVATSLAAGENLDYFFQDTLRWEITDSAIGAVEEGLAGSTRSELALSSFSYEPFTIESNTVQGNGSGSGWFSNWQMQNPNGVMEIRDGSLVYDSLHTEGKHLFFAPSTDEPRIELTRFMDKNLGCEGSSVWLCFLFRADKVANGGVEIVPGISLYNTFGKIWGNNLGIYTSPSQEIQEGETYFLVSKINIASGEDTMFLWVNPTLDSEPTESEAGVVYTGYDVGTINRVQLLVQGWGQGEYNVDEIRVGDNWNSVAPTKKLPVILKSPASQIVCENDNLSLSVTAEGQNISYQWYKDDMVLDGQTDSLLFVPDLSDGIKGSYHCYVYNEDGIGIESSKAHISFQPKPSIDFNLPDTISINDAPLDLIGTTPDAFFSVNGSILESFDPSIFGIGTHQLEYAFNDGDCFFTTSKSIVVTDSTITGIRAFDEIITAYPNPTRAEIKIKLPPNLTLDRLSLSDYQGKRTYLRSDEISEGLNNVLLSDTPSGLYILQIWTSRGSFSKKIVIQ